MKKLEMLKLWIFDREEYAYQVLAMPIRKRIEQNKKKHKKYNHLFKNLEALRMIKMTSKFCKN